MFYEIDLGNQSQINLVTYFCKLYCFIIVHYFSHNTETVKLTKESVNLLKMFYEIDLGNHSQINLVTYFLSYTVSLLYTIFLVTLKRSSLHEQCVNLLQNVFDGIGSSYNSLVWEKSSLSRSFIVQKRDQNRT